MSLARKEIAQLGSFHLHGQIGSLILFFTFFICALLHSFMSLITIIFKLSPNLLLLAPISVKLLGKLKYIFSFLFNYFLFL